MRLWAARKCCNPSGFPRILWINGRHIPFFDALEGGSAMRAVAAICVLVSAWAAIGIGQESVKPSGEEGRIIALESAWDQAEKNKDATALAGLLADNLVYVDYDGSLRNKQQFLARIKIASASSEQINNEAVTVRLYANNVERTTGLNRSKRASK